MLKNINYNLMESITIISKSLYRYDAFIKDASDCKACKELWAKIKTHREIELSMLLKELQAHMKGGKVKFDHYLDKYISSPLA